MYTPKTTPRALAVAASGALLIAFAVGCSATPSSPASPASSASSSTPQADATPNALQTMYDSVVDADPRVTDPLATVSRSGTNTVLSLSVLIIGDEAVSTQTLTAVMLAARDSSIPFDQLDLNARSAANSEQILDLTRASEGLPRDANVLAVDGGVTVMRGGLEKLGG